MKLNAAEELNIDELDAVAAGAFSSMDVNSKITPWALWLLPYGARYAAGAATYDALR